MLQTRNDACFFEVNGRQIGLFTFFGIGDILGHYQFRSPRMRRRNAELAYCEFITRNLREF